MRKATWLSAAIVTALVVASVAVAHGGGSKSAAAVAGTFTATTVSDAKTSTCTNADGAWTHVDATYTGIAAGDADLAGPVQLRVHAVINTTKNVGVVTGSLRIDTAGTDTKARLDTVYSGGKVSGLASGRAHDPSAGLLANVSGSYSLTGGFTNGKIGGGTEGGTAVELVSGACAKPPVEKAILHLKGSVVSASTTSLVVKSGTDQITCAVDASTGLAAAVAKLQPGQAVAATCKLSNGSYELASLDGKRHEDKRHDRR
jgi:hypothetical protein